MFKNRLADISVKWLLVVGTGVFFGFSAFIFGGPVCMVDWSETCVVALESDDWGLAGFVPHEGSWEGVPRECLERGPTFPEVYWGSTLEDGSMVAGLCAVLGKHKGADGLAAVFQPNYVMSSLNWEQDGNSPHWQQYDLPALPPHFSRPTLWAEVHKGIGEGVWYPEFHATWHYDPEMRKEAAHSSSQARAITNAGIMLFPGSELARELGPWRDIKVLEGELQHSLAVFKNLFSRYPGSVIAPDYTWDRRHELLWMEHGISVIQAKREQRKASAGFSSWDRIKKVLSRRLEYMTNGSLVYLERNCRFETAQRPDHADPVAMAAMVDEVVQATVTAWNKGQPAIVETHRVNFAHTDSRIVIQGQKMLDSYLENLLAEFGEKTIFVSSMEIAQLYRQGTSICLRGNNIVVRNATHSRRLVAIPPEILSSISDNGYSPKTTALIFVGPGENLVIPVRQLLY